MTGRYVVSYTAECDACGATAHTTAEGHAGQDACWQALTQVRKLGWAIFPGRWHDYCPACRGAEE